MRKAEKASKIAGRHFFLIRDAQNCNPNGDPLNDNLPRVDARDDGEYAMISDVSIKRIIRDYLHKNGIPIFFLNQISESGKKKKAGDKNKTGTHGRIDTLKEEAVISNTSTDEFLKKLVDVRWFGLTRTDKANDGEEGKKDKSKNGSVTGAIQFKFMNYSMNKVNIMTSQHSSVLPSDTDNGQGSLGIMKTIKYGVSVIKATLNPNVWADNYKHLSDITESLSDIDRFKFSLFYSTMELNTRARNNMNSIALLEVIYNNRTNSDGTLCSPAWGGVDLGTTFKIVPKKGMVEEDIRNSNDYDLDFDSFIEAVKKNKSRIKEVKFHTENEAIREKLLKAGFKEDAAFSEVLEKEAALY